MSAQRNLTVPANTGTPVRLAVAKRTQSGKARQVVVQPTAAARVGGKDVTASGATKGILLTAGSVSVLPEGLYIIADGGAATDATVVTV